MEPALTESDAEILMRPEGAKALLVLAHGAGAGMRHAFMEAVARALSLQEIATWRYEFPYMAAGRRRPDRPTALVGSVRAAVARAREAAPDLPLFAGGKSMGGRMTSTAEAENPLRGTTGDDPVRGLVFLGFPLHPAGKPGTSRADHLADVDRAMLFVQGDRDRLADLELLRPVVANLGKRATLHVIEGADHGFHVLKRSGRTDEEVITEIASVTASWMASRVAGGSTRV